MQALFGSFGPAASMNVTLRNTEGRPTRSMPTPAGPPATQFIFTSGETVEGDVAITLGSSKKVEHTGIKIELKGVVDVFDKAQAHEFTALVAELAPAGVLTSSQTFPFSFSRVDLPHESYEGLNARCKYFLRATISRGSYSSSIIKELEFQVQNIEPVPSSDTAVKLEVGIEDCLHIEFEYDRARYHLADVITGRVHFLLVRIRIKYMEVTIIRRETAGIATAQPTTESETLTRFEVMDGCPVRGERIPIRMYLSSLDLTPTYTNIANAFSVRYYVNLVLVDEEDRRYFKQQEIQVWRNMFTDKPALVM